MHRHRQKQHGKITRPLFWYFSERQTIDRYVEKGRLKKIMADIRWSECRPDGVKPVNLQYIDVPDKDLSCPICYEPVWRPTLLPCGHRFCEDCLHDAVLFQETDHNIKLCPYCRAETPQNFWDEQGPDAVHPTYPHEQLDQALVRCPNEPEGCDKVLERHLVTSHVVRHCLYTGSLLRKLTQVELKCPDETCEKLVLRKNLSRWDGCLHQLKQCPRPMCQTEFEVWEQGDHDRTCAALTLSCPMCSEIFTRDLLEEHAAACKQKCAASAYGCNFTGDTIEELAEHEKTCAILPLGRVIERQQSVLSSYSDALCWADIGSIGSVLQNLTNFAVQQNVKITALERELGELRALCREATSKAGEAEESIRQEIPSLHLHLLNTEDAQNRTNLMLESGIARLGSETTAQWDALESLRRISVNPMMPMMRPHPGAVAAAAANASLVQQQQQLQQQQQHLMSMPGPGVAGGGGVGGGIAAGDISDDDFPPLSRVVSAPSSAPSAAGSSGGSSSSGGGGGGIMMEGGHLGGAPGSLMASGQILMASQQQQQQHHHPQQYQLFNQDPYNQQQQHQSLGQGHGPIPPAYPRRRSSAERSTKL